MMLTAADVRREHSDAILSMSPKQRRVLDRVLEAKQLGYIGPLSGRTMDERLNEVCAREAARLNTEARENPLDVLFKPVAGQAEAA